MIVEIAAYDLVDGNRYVPAEVMGRLYRKALKESAAVSVLDAINTPDFSGVPDLQVVVRDPIPGAGCNIHGDPLRAIIRVGAGGRISLDNARLMFALKDIVEAVIESVDPPFGEWYPLQPDPLAALPDAKEWMRNTGPRLVGEPTPNQESNPL